MLKKPFVVLDLETTGVDPRACEIIEIALIRYENGREVARLNELIKIESDLPKIITAITGITDEEIRSKGKPANEIFGKAEKLLKKAYLVGHNIKFDIEFLRAKGVDLEILGQIDTVPLSQIVFPQLASFSLESLAADLGIEHTASHRAMGDAEATLELLNRLMEEIEKWPKELLKDICSCIKRSTWDGQAVFLSCHSERQRRVSQMTCYKETLRPFGAQGDIEKIPSRPLDIESVLGPQGVMAQFLPSYEYRLQQEKMAKAISNAFEHGYHLICEAPTGIGKSMAYLAAAAQQAIANKSKIVISTNTINLQEQLYQKDIPLLQKLYKEATGSYGIRAAVLKGRSHYLCLRRLAEFKKRPTFTEKEIILLTKILVWRVVTQTGDSSELALTREDAMIWDFELCADQKYCSQEKCKNYGECYLFRARKMAENANLIIVNHALLCADLKLASSSGGQENGLLPEYQYLVIDEAHHFEEAATGAFATEIAQENLSLPIKVIEYNLKQLDESPWRNSILESIPDLQQLIDNFFSIVAIFINRNVPDSGYTEHLLVDRVILGMPEWSNLMDSMEKVMESLDSWISALSCQPLTDELEQEKSVLCGQIENLKTFFSDEEILVSQKIRWMSSNLSGTVSLHLAPLLIGPLLRPMMYDKKKSIILTSATLSVQSLEETNEPLPPFHYLRRMLDLDERFEELMLDSPFNFEIQACVFLPNDAFPLSANRSMEQVSDFFARLIKSVKGGILGLFTAYSAIENLYLSLMNRPETQSTRILGQRISGGRNKIIKTYLADPKNSVLLGTASFWEGVDIQGEALTTLVIHRLPFDVPSEPIFKARQELFSNPFMEYSVPRAVLRFSQGFGRLIRSKKDYGCLMVLDNRVTTKDFGQLFLHALPKGIPIERAKLSDIPKKALQWLEMRKTSNES